MKVFYYCGVLGFCKVNTKKSLSRWIALRGKTKSFYKWLYIRKAQDSFEFCTCMPVSSYYLFCFFLNIFKLHPYIIRTKKLFCRTLASPLLCWTIKLKRCNKNSKLTRTFQFKFKFFLKTQLKGKWAEKRFTSPRMKKSNQFNFLLFLEWSTSHRPLIENGNSRFQC